RAGDRRQQRGPQRHHGPTRVVAAQGSSRRDQGGGAWLRRDGGVGIVGASPRLTLDPALAQCPKLRTPDEQQDPAANGAPFSPPTARRSILRELLIGPVHLFAFASGLALLVALGLLVAISWRGLQRLEPFDQYLQQQRNLLALSHAIQELQTAAPNPTRLLALRTQIRALVDSGGFADPTSSTNLLAAARALDTRRGAPVGLAEANARV